MDSKNHKKRRAAKSHNRGRSIVPYERLPSYKQQVKREWKVRTVVSTGGVLSVFTVQQVASILGIFATGATTSVQFVNQFKLLKVEMWDIPSAIGSPVTVAAKWVDNPLPNNVAMANFPVSVSDTTESVTNYAHIVLKPSLGDVAFGVLPSNGTANLLVLSAAGDAFVDFTFQFVIDDIGPLNSGPTIAGATPGVIYHKIATGSSGMVLTAVNDLNSI